MYHRRRIADGDDIVFPVGGKFLHGSDHVSRRQFRARNDLAWSGLPGSKDLYMCTAHIHDKNVHSDGSGLGTCGQGGALGSDDFHQVVPRFNEGLGALGLQLRC